MNDNSDPGREMKADVGFVWAKRAGVARIVIEYSGGGDSGDTDKVLAFDRKGKPFELPEHFVKVLEGWAWGPNLIPQTGWWNNDGGYGTVTIRLDRRIPTVRVKHYDNEVTTRGVLNREESGLRELNDEEQALTERSAHE